MVECDYIVICILQFVIFIKPRVVVLLVKKKTKQSFIHNQHSSARQ